MFDTRQTAYGSRKGSTVEARITLVKEVTKAIARGMILLLKKADDTFGSSRPKCAVLDGGRVQGEY